MRISCLCGVLSWSGCLKSGVGVAKGGAHKGGSADTSPRGWLLLFVRWRAGAIIARYSRHVDEGGLGCTGLNACEETLHAAGAPAALFYLRHHALMVVWQTAWSSSVQNLGRV